MTTQQQLLQQLADGQVHSGEELAEALSLSRAAIWKQVEQLRELGVDIAAQAGKGYQLSRALELLSANEISASLNPATRQACAAVDVCWITDSTNHQLTQLGPPPSGKLQVCAAEFQTAGRGRRGRQWLAPFGDGLCLSVGWRFAQAPSNLSSLGLAVGVGLLRGMKRLGLDDVELKWPNDLLRSGGKLAGILIEVSGEAEGPLHVIVGVGINYRISVATGEQVRATGGVAPAAMSAATAVDAMADYQLPGRNAVIAVVIDELYGVLTAFANDGLEQFLAEWRANDFLAGKEIVVALGKQKVTGRAAGITPDGQLQVATEKGVQHVLGGDVSVRARA